MKLSVRALWLSVAMMGCAPAAAQEVRLPGGYSPGVAIGYGAPGNGWTAVDEAHPLPVAPRQDLALLASGNTAMAAQTVYGGDYLFGQSCTAYGTIALQVLAADGASFQTIVTRNAADPAPVGVALGSNAIVRVDLSGTNGCAANLSRVP